MNSGECARIAEWFIREYEEWIKDNKLLSWSEKLRIYLNKDSEIDDTQLFQLFVLAVLWNNGETSNAETGIRVYEEIRDRYTLKNFVNATNNQSLTERLRAIHPLVDKRIFYLLSFIVNGQIQGTSVWTRIKNIINSPNIGVKEDDEIRLTNLYNLFNSLHQRSENAFFTVKTFLIFRELRIQFHALNMYQYHPAICCVPDSHVRRALHYLNLRSDWPEKNRIDNLIATSEVVAEHFCSGKYELYDLPLFQWDKNRRPTLEAY
jgi:hypothetical protein